METCNHGDSKADVEFLLMKNGKSLSKNLLYAPLLAYHKSVVKTSDNNDGSATPQYPSIKHHDKNPLMEASLVSTLNFISSDYHRNRATISGAKNNGSRPLNLSDVEDRIRRRAVTLVGGGINTANTVQKTVIRPKKRRHRQWEEVKPILSKITTEKIMFESASCHGVSFLKKLNSAWNQYASKLLLNDKQQMSGSVMKEIEIKIEFLLGRAMNGKMNRNRSDRRDRNYSAAVNEKDVPGRHPLRLIGAHVQVQSSNSHVSWIGKFGVVIGETPNTYRIAFSSRRLEHESTVVEEAKGNFPDEVRNMQPDSSNSGFRIPAIQILVLPKAGLSLRLILPLPSSQGETNKQKLNPEEVTDESVIVVPDEALCISIQDQKIS